MSYGLIVEGAYDKAVFEELVARIASPGSNPIVRVCGGVSQLMKQFPSYLRDLEHAVRGQPVDKAIVIRDWRGPDLIALEQRMSQRVEDKQFSFLRGVQFCGVQQEMETWLLADVGAINSVALGRNGRIVPPVQGDLEQIGNPKERLVEILSRAGIVYDAETCREIAQRSDIEILKYRCPSFRSFEGKVLDC